MIIWYILGRGWLWFQHVLHNGHWAGMLDLSNMYGSFHHPKN